jgi:hypothetical protein
MHLLPLGVGVAVVLSALAAQQGLPPMKTNEPSNRQTIRVRGCIRGRTLVETQGGPGITLNTYHLAGSRAIVATLKEHDGHEDEIVGTVQIADTKKFKATKEKKVGNGRVLGSASSDKTSGEPQSPVEFPIDVDTITHINMECPRK